MAKKIMAVVLGFVLAPAFITAQNGFGSSIVGSTCLVRVYHSNFSFPPEGGRIVQIGNEMFFWKTYLPECLNMLPANTPVMVTTYAGAQSASSNPVALHGANGGQIADNPCAVRVYHTNFNFPPEGGKVIKVGNEMFFVKTYLPECANVGNAGVTLAQGSSGYNLVQSNTYTTAYNNPVVGNVQSASRTTCY